MANTINYVDKYNTQLLERVDQGTLISPFINNNVDFFDGKNFHFKTMMTSGLFNHNVAGKGAWNNGDV